MISFDRKAGNVNLTPVWDAINSIKSDTSSIWNFVSTITGVDIASSIMSSISSMSSDITSLNNNTLYFNNELYSLKTDTSSMVSDTAGLNMDIVSLYNICSSLSDSVSTITGGGGGGLPYYLALSDAEASSLKYVYNMTGDILSLPSYDSFTFMGNMGTFESYSVLNKSFKLHGLESVASLTFSTDGASNKFDYIDIAAKSMVSNQFYRYFDRVKIQCESFYANSLSTISNLYLSVETLDGMSLRTATGVINANIMSNCYFSSFMGTMNVNMLSKNTFTNVRSPISANFVVANSINHYSYKDICALSQIGSNTFNFGGVEIMPNFHAPIFNYNSMTDCGGNFTIYADSIIQNTFSLYTGHNATFSDCKINLVCSSSCYGNKCYNINTLVLSGKIQGGHVFSKISELKFYATQFTFGGGHAVGGDANGYSDITLLDFRGLTPTSAVNSVNLNTASIIGVQTMKVNYDLPIILYHNGIRPANIYTLDFYKCESAISASIFTMPSVFSGYDEGNVWISGKPLSELGYTLTTATA
jgi:hypothetical protein